MYVCESKRVRLEVTSVVCCVGLIVGAATRSMARTLTRALAFSHSLELSHSPIISLSHTLSHILSPVSHTLSPAHCQRVSPVVPEPPAA